ncbi:conserved hypothetical protein [Candidatus Terasakiella magnetica]|uniref:Uncharacterized protein n=1 Tax=Candidatus Terasakiella magnetica TaxID=1867952 RepID=A0A1C3RLQ4_9PROT|nr:hypothetical protein [Candidatus Terasakiella magnetica]SCA58240.1 conserved hypothetical protein [Candidatus Terasakiella magnetica]
MTTKISNDYKFYAGFLRFVAAKTDKSDVNVNAMMAELNQAADQLDNGSRFTLLASRAQATSRAFAGVAQFLQHRILPEAQAHGDEKAIKQLEWAVAASLQVGRAIILHLDDIEPDKISTDFIEIKMPVLDRIPGVQNEEDKPTLH